MRDNVVSTEQHGWRPIETAPRDGTNILLLCDFGDRREMTIARWSDNPLPAGPFGKFMWREMQDSTVAEKVPTHWQPLPALPVFMDDQRGER